MYLTSTSANTLIDKSYNGKLGDFGFATELPEVHHGRTLVTAQVFAKTLGYLPPELQYKTTFTQK